ncbi:MAG: hypothetical protein IPK83_12905 [Planctomycetes bacterium]|nr:hypothetical protein [Planctomycetota bacterium]
MTITAFRRTYDKNTWAETKVESATVTTDAKTGIGRATLKLTKGGSYILRAEGKDTRGETVTAEATVQVSDDEDATRLRIFSDRENYKVGDAITLDIHSRVEDSLKTASAKSPENSGERNSAAASSPFIAVLMCEGEGVFEYRTVTLKPGHNSIELPIGHNHFPNFKLSTAVMTGGRFHQASRDFTVERELNVAVKPRQATAHPRDELLVDLIVTDQMGKPVQGEIGIAMIDGALLAQYPDTTPKIVPFFQSTARRSANSRTESSCIFRYQPATTSMVTEILDFDAVVSTIDRGLAARGTIVPNYPVDEAFGSQTAQLEGMVQSLGYVGTRPNAAEPVESQEYDMSADGLADMDEEGSAFDNSPNVSSSVALSTRHTSVFRRGFISPEMKEGRGRSAGINIRPGSPNAQTGGLGGGKFLQGGGFGGGGGGGDGGGLYGDDRKDAAGQTLWFSLESAPETLGREAYKQQFQSRLFEASQSWFKSGTIDNRVIDKNLGDAVRSAPDRTYYPEVAYWNPHVVTDAAGKATITIVLPDTSTTWKIVARGATKETVVGEGSADVLSKNDFLVEWTTPPTLIEGDKFTPRGQVHCLAPFSGTIKLRYEAQRANGEPVADGEKTIEAKSSGVFDVDFDPIDVPSTEKLSLTLTAEAVADAKGASNTTPTPKPSPIEGDEAGGGAGQSPNHQIAKSPNLSDSLTLAIPVQSWGLRIESHVAGVAKDSDFVEIELPALPGGEAYHDTRLVVALGSSMQRWLIEEALETGGRWTYIDSSLKGWRSTPPRTHADTAAVLLGALYAGDYVSSNAAAQDPKQTADRALLDERVAGLIGQLLAAQRDDGGWAWCGTGGESDPWTSASIAWSLGKAKYNNHPLAAEPLNKLRAYLQKTFADAPIHQTELKAVVLHGLSWIDDIDFGHANRLYRNREDLSTAGLAHLALTFVKLDRKPLAAELLEQLARKSKQITRGMQTLCEIDATHNSAWMRSELEVTALALLGAVAD